MRMRQIFLARLEAHSRREHLFLWLSSVLALFLLLLDQGTKLWVERTFELHESRPLIDGWLSFTSVRNYGAAWSMLSGHGWILLVIAIVALAAILWSFHSLTDGWPERYVAAFMVISGILGNSIDRLWRGAVVDFIDVHYYSVWRYPVFNVADIAICTGVGIFILSTLSRPEKAKGTAENADR